MIPRLSGISAAARALRDRAAERIINRSAFRRYGEISGLRLDPRAGEAAASVRLAGEDAPIEIRLSCRLERSGGRRFLVIDRVSASRAWIETLFADLAGTRPARIELSPETALALRLAGW